MTPDRFEPFVPLHLQQAVWRYAHSTVYDQLIPRCTAGVSPADLVGFVFPSDGSDVVTPCGRVKSIALPSRYGCFAAVLTERDVVRDTIREMGVVLPAAACEKLNQVMLTDSTAAALGDIGRLNYLWIARYENGADVYQSSVGIPALSRLVTVAQLHGQPAQREALALFATEMREIELTVMRLRSSVIVD